MNKGLNYIKGLNKGDKKIFRQVFEEFYPSLILFANRYLNDSEQAEDMVQETFIGLWERRTTLYSENGLKSYLYQSVKNKSLNYIRHGKLKDRHISEELRKKNADDFESFFIEEESLRLFYKIIEELPEKQKEVVLLTLKGLNRNEIAEQLDITVDTVKYHKQKAFSILREKLKGNFYLLLIATVFLKI
jgi:RNA polymerase sigma-70 factor (ECF subfamily)